MGAPTSVLRGARAFARDMAREAMAPGYLWDVADFVPALIDTQLTGRGAWLWASATGASTDYEAGILAPYTSGEQNLGAAGGTLYQIAGNPPYPLTNRGTVPVARQNPVMLFDQVIWLSGDGSLPPTIVGPTGAPIPLAVANVKKVKVGTIWGEYFVGANAPGAENTVYFAPPDNVNQAWDPNALVQTAGQVNGLAALRTVILIFHASSIERLRGTRPPAGTDKGDMVLEPLFQQVGTTEPRTICYWQENILFADEHGVHITDGASLRNLVQQGSISSYWRNLYNNKQSLAAAVYLDYYVISVRRTDGIVDCLICDLNTRQWFRFSNIDAISMWASGGTVGMERLWGGMHGTSRVGLLSAMFFPPPVASPQQDANGVYVMPSFETPFYKLSSEGRKRIRFVYLSYDSRNGGGTSDMLRVSYILSPQDTNWTSAGGYPPTSRYTRYRLPVGKVPYGIAFQVKQITPSTVTRISDLAVDTHAIERSRV